MDETKKMKEQIKTSDKIKEDFEVEWSQVFNLAKEQMKGLNSFKKTEEIDEMIKTITRPILEENMTKDRLNQTEKYEEINEKNAPPNFCANCGFKLSLEDKFCKKCGEKIQ